MSYTPTGMFATDHRVRVMLSSCAIVQTLMGVADFESAMAKVTAYGEEVDEQNVPVLAYPSGQVCMKEQHFTTGTMGEILDIPLRTVECWFGLYVPENEDIVTHSDEKHWIDDQFSEIIRQCLELTGTGEPIAGETHVHVVNPTYHGCEREPADERGDAALDSQPDRPRWFGLVTWEIH